MKQNSNDRKWFVFLTSDFHRKQPLVKSSNQGAGKYFQELDGLQKLLHFPEEVAILLTEAEYDLFNNVPPAHYVRQVTCDLTRGTTIHQRLSNVEDLIERFNEVGINWFVSSRLFGSFLHVLQFGKIVQNLIFFSYFHQIWCI